MSPTACTRSRLQDRVWICPAFSGSGAGALFPRVERCLHNWRSLFQRSISSLHRLRKACTAAASVPIHAMKPEGSPIPSAVLCNRKRSPRDAESHSAECNRKGRSSSRTRANPLRHHIETLPPFAKPWTRIEQALRVTDLLLQGGGFSAIVLDMGSIAPEYATRVPLATWFRYRAAAERTQVSVLLLTQCPCAKSSVELLLRFNPGEALRDEATVFTGIGHCVEVVRQRFSQASTNVVPLRKPPQKVTGISWESRTAWARSR